MEQPRARYRRFEGKVATDGVSGERMNGAVLREPGIVFRFQNGLLHGGIDTFGIAVESGTDGYYEKWKRGELKEAGCVMEDGEGKTWKEEWEEGKRKNYWENGVLTGGRRDDEEE
jgi:hypothetical protein